MGYVWLVIQLWVREQNGRKGMASRISVNGGPWEPLDSQPVYNPVYHCLYCGGRCEARLCYKGEQDLPLCHRAECKRRIYPTLKYLMKKDAENRRNLEKGT